MTKEENNINLQDVDEIVSRLGGQRRHVIQLLQAIQTRYQYLPKEVLARICDTTQITPAQITGVASFYSQFRFSPVGKHRIRVCHGTACHIKGSVLIHEAFYRHLGITEGEDTDSQRLFTVEKVACLGCCTLAPVVQINDVVYGNLTPDKIPDVINSHLEYEKLPKAKRSPIATTSALEYEGEIRIGLGSCCVAKGSDLLKKALEDEVAKNGAHASVKRVGCVGMCYQTPIVEILQPGLQPVLYARVGPQEAKAIVDKHFKPRGIARKLKSTIVNAVERMIRDEAWEPVSRFSIGVRDKSVAAFLDRQTHIATEHFGYINPFDLEEYRSYDGFKALEHCLKNHSPEQVIKEVHSSGLRGRGGAGYLSGLKWQKVRSADGEKKYVICNGDEGDPGAFMDRMLLESFPYRIIEGMAIAAYAVGADEAILYVRAEYPLALSVLSTAIERCKDNGYLGRNILGGDFSLDMRIAEGAGAFVSGEETALLAALEGERSMPRLRPPYPAEKGLWGQPTLINNVETYSLVPWIMRNGADRFAQLGTEKSKGTKVFALAGKVASGGLIEVPMGITLREIVEEIGGGIAGGRRFKAVQVGGPSGGCVPAQFADIPVDYEALSEVGAIMGSGGLVVLDETDCMVDIARYFLEFTQIESCGKCTFCRIGSKRMLEILLRLCSGKARKDDLAQPEELVDLMKKASFCGLGKTAPNPVLTSLKYFRDEYEAHLKGRCPAGKCRELISYSINDSCNGCTICYQNCPVDAIKSIPYKKHEIDPYICIRCNMCKVVCPEDAVEVEYL